MISACSLSSYCFTLKPIVKVLIGVLDSLVIIATTIELSIPPDKNAPNIYI